MSEIVYLSREELKNVGLVTRLKAGGYTVERLKRSTAGMGKADTIRGWREFEGDKRYYLKSKWEINFAYYSDWMKRQGHIKDWVYEPDTFWFEGVRRGVNNYKPDFRWLEYNGTYTYYEIKGYMDSKSATKIRRMAKYFPDVKLILIDEEQYNELRRFERLLNFE